MPQDPIDLTHNQIAACRLCHGGSFEVQSSGEMERGNPRARVMVVGLAPSPTAQREHRAFAGNSFARLIGWFSQAGFPGSDEELRASLYLTSANKCAASPDNLKHRRSLWTRCSGYLWKQIDTLKPQLVLLLGKEVVDLGFGALPRFTLAVGRAFSTKEIFKAELFPPTSTPTRWLILPHPSGMSRIMNDGETRNRVIASLKDELVRARFSILRSMEAS